MQIYTSATIDEGHPTERTFRIVRHRDRAGWEVQGNRGELDGRADRPSTVSPPLSEQWWSGPKTRLTSAKRRAEKAP
jgi:hypothetical protein